MTSSETSKLRCKGRITAYFHPCCQHEVRRPPTASVTLSPGAEVSLSLLHRHPAQQAAERLVFVLLVLAVHHFDWQTSVRVRECRHMQERAKAAAAISIFYLRRAEGAAALTV